MGFVVYTIPVGLRNMYSIPATTTRPTTEINDAVPTSQPVVLISKMPVIWGASKFTKKITPRVMAKIAPTTCRALKFCMLNFPISPQYRDYK